MTINLADRLSALTTDSAGTTHVVWVENTSLWHAVYNANSGTWENAQAIANVGNQPLTSLNLIANDKLIQPSSGNSTAPPAPGLVVVYQQGSGNDSDIFYTAGRYNPGGRTEWLNTPQALTADQVGDLAPTAIAMEDGTVFVVGQKVDAEQAKNQATREDTDLYYQSFTVSQNQFSSNQNSPTSGNIIQGNSYNYLGRNRNAPAANYEILSAGETEFLGSKLKSNGLGLNWNASSDFNLNGLSLLIAKDLGEQPEKVLERIFGPLILSVSLQGSSGNNPEWSLFGGGEASNGRLLLNALATVGKKKRRDITNNEDSNRFDKWRRQGRGALGEGSQDGLDLSFTLSSLYSYGNSNANPDGKFPLYLETGGAFASLAGSIPLFGFDNILNLGLNANFGLFFNAGVALQWQVAPKNPGAYFPLLAPYLDLSGNTDRLLITDGFSVTPGFSQTTAVLALLSNLEAAFASIDPNSSVELESLLVGVPVTLGFEGSIEIPFIFKLFGSIGFFADGTFTIKGDTPSSITIGAPFNLNVSLLGFISAKIAGFPTWTRTFPSSPSQNSQSGLEANNTASVDGFLLTINLAQSLEPNLSLNPADFTVTVTNANGKISTIPVFGVVVQTDNQSNTGEVILRLEQEIPYTTLNGQPFSKITVNYSGNQLGNFTSIPVALQSSDTLIYTYNPTSGTGNDYSQNNQQITIAFNGSLDPNILPFENQLLNWFTVTNSSNQAIVITDVAVNQSRIVLTLASNTVINSGEIYTVQYNPDANSDQQLKTANQETITAFTVSNDTAPTARGLVNRTFVSIANVQTQPVLSKLTSDFAQDSSPALALTSQENIILLAWSSDTPPITPISVLAEGDYLYLVFADNLKNDSANPPSNDQFTIKTSDGSITNPTNVSLSENTVTLNIDSSVDVSQIVEVGYSLSNASLSSNLYLSDATNTEFWVPNFTNTVEFSSSITTAPIPLQGSVISKLITIPFNQTLNSKGIPNSSQFQVVVNGNTANPINVTNVTVDDTSVTLKLETIVGQGQLVSVTYTPNSNGENNLVSNASTPQTIASFSTNNFLTTASSSSTVIKTAFSPFGDSGISSIITIPGTSGLNSDVVATLYQNPTTGTVQNVVAWVNVDTSALSVKTIPGQNYSTDDAALITTAVQQSNIYYAVLGPNNQWSLAAPLVSNQAGQDQKVTLGAGPDGSLLAAWLNTQLDSNGNPSTTIQSATFDGTQWIELIIPDGQNSTINPNSFSELSIRSINGQPAIFWTESKPPSYSNLVANENPLIYLRLAEIGGTTAINQGQLSLAGNGTYSTAGGYTLGRVGALENTSSNTGDFNPAVLFNGGGVTINSPVPVAVQGFSVEFWFKLPTAGGVVGLANLAGVFDLSLNGDNLTFTLNNGSNSQIVETITTDHWHYLVGTYDPVKEILTLYLDGQLVDSLENIAFANLPKSGTLTLAGNGGPVYLDEFAFYNSVLSYTANSSSPGSTNNNFLNLTGSQLVDSVLGVNEIGSHYQARFFEPVTAGPETNYIVWDSGSNGWQSPVSINPVDEVIPTILSAANNPVWDIVSAGSAFNDNIQIAPNGNPDTIFQVNLTGEQGNEVVGISVTTGNKQLWSVGTDGAENPLGGLQLGVVLAENVNTTTPQLGFISGDKLLNSLNPGASFSHRVMGATETFTIFVDTEGTLPVSSATVNVYLQGQKDPIPFTSLAPIPNQGGPVPANSPDYLDNQVLGIATIKEANDATLSLVDSGFVVNTDNPAIAAVMASGFSNGALAYVAVGNRGYTSQGNSVGGTIQILFAGGDVLSQKSTLPLTTTDLSGNSDGVLITGIDDTGDINNDVPMALVTGDVDGDGVDDLVIGNANHNEGKGRIYVIKGQYLNGLKGKNQTLDLTNASQWSSNQGFVIDGVDAGGGAGFSVAIGNFTGSSPQIAFGAPFAKNSNGVAVGKVYRVSPSNPSQLTLVHTGETFNLTNPQNPAQTVTVGETAGYSLGVSRQVAGGPVTFTNNTTDDLFIGSSTYGVAVSNQWVGKSALPSNNQGNYPDQVTIAAGAVHVFSQPSGQSFGKVATYTGPNIPAANGVASNYLAGAAISLGEFTDLDGDGHQDLAITALGANDSAGAVYVLSGSKFSQSSNLQALNEVSQLTINGGIAGGRAGMAIISPGDVNGDGYQDFLITAPQAGNGTGQSYLLFGPFDLSKLGSQFDLSATGSDSSKVFVLNGSLPNQLAGTAVASLGNFTGQKRNNNTPIDSFLISAPNAQQFYVVFGQPWLADDGSLNLADVASDNGFVIDGNLIGTAPTTFETTSQYIDTTPAILVDGSTLYMAYKGFGGNNQIYFTVSTNNGQSWNSEVQLPVAAQTIFPPAIAFFNNVLYLAYVDSNKGLNIITSQDGGQNWNAPLPLGGTSSTPPTLVVYQGTLSLLFAANNSNSNVLQFYLNSSNEWIYADAIGSNQTAISAISATVLGDTLYLVYKGGSGNNPSTLDYITSTTNADLSANDWNSIPIPGVSSQGGPNLTNDGTNLYLSYLDSSNQLNLVSSSNGSNWSASQVITNNISQAPPAIAFANNELYLSYPGPQGSQELNVTSFPLPFTGSILGNGSLVRFLGDVNGDGFADVFSGGTNAGAIIFGNSTQDLLTTASGSEDLLIYVPNATLRDVVSLGDFNGDGIKDLGVLDSNGNFYVVLGNTSLGDLKTLSITSSSSPVVINQVGGVTKSMAIGDYNGNGYDDVLLWGDNGNQVAWGNPNGALDSFTNIDYPETQTSAIGVDLNGDGITEIAISSDERKIAGQISTSGSFSLLPTPTTSSVINTLAAANQLENIGDFNGDGIGDLAVLASNYYAAAIGEPNNLPNYLSRPGNQGGVFIFYGSVNGLSDNAQPDVILAAPFTNPSGQISTYQLSRIAQAGDVNGDGFDDLLIGSPYTVDAEGNQGSVFVVFGGDAWKSTPFDLGQLRANQSQGSNPNGFAIDGLPNSQAGISLSGGGDINGDGFADFIIGAPGQNSLQYNQQSVFVENGRDDIDQNYTFIYYLDGSAVSLLGNNAPWQSNEILTNQIVANWQNNSRPPQTIIGQSNGDIWYYPGGNNQNWELFNNPPNKSGFGVTELSVQWNDSGDPNIVLSYENGEIWYFRSAGNGGSWSEIGNLKSDITQMAVQWGNDGSPAQIVVGLGNGEVGYYNAQSGWQTINNFRKSITELSVQWQENGNPNIVAGLDNSEVQYYQGSNGVWTQFHDGGWIYPVQQLAVQWTSNDTQPLVVVGLGDNNGNNGSVWYYQGSSEQGGWTLLSGLPSGAAIAQMAVQWNVSPSPSSSNNVSDLKIVVGQADSTVSYYNGNGWTATPAINSSLQIPTLNAMTVQWNANGQPQITVGLGDPEYDNGQLWYLPSPSQSWQELQGSSNYASPITQIDSSWTESLVPNGQSDNLSYVFFGSDFNQTVNQTGTIGDDVMLGSATGESFLAGQGDDQIYTKGGLDVVYAGPGDDWVSLSDTYFRRLNGGTGFDILALEGYNGQNWDITTLAPGLRLQDFESIDIRDYGANQLTINALSVINLSSNNTVIVLMDESGDSLQLSSDFSADGTTYQYGQRFYQYKSNNSAAIVLVNQPTAPSFTAPSQNQPQPVLPSGNGTSNGDFVSSDVANTGNINSQNVNAPTKLFVSSPNVSEAMGEVNFVIERTGNLGKYVVASYLTQDRDGKAGDRYLPVAGQLVFNPGETKKTVTVKVPNDGIYTGDRQFGLLVSLLQEGLQPGNWAQEFSFAADADGAQIRNWNYLLGESTNSLTGGVISFSTTVNDSQAQVKLDVNGLGEFNDFGSYNPVTGNYQSLMLNGVTGAKFTNFDEQNNPQGLAVQLLDGDRGDADGLTNGLVQTKGYLDRVTPGLITNDNRVFWAPTSADGQVQLRLINSPNQNYAMGWIEVDDANGSIDGLLPDDLGYEAAALARKQIIFSDQNGASTKALTRSLAQDSFTNVDDLIATDSQFFGDFSNVNLEANRYYILYSQQGDETTFSIDTAPTIETDSRGYHQLNFAGITAEIGSKTLVVPGLLNQVVTAEVSISRAGAYNNAIALYRVDSLTGGLDLNGDRQIDLKPGDSGYTEAALGRAQDPLTGVSLTAPDSFFSTTQQTVNLLGNQMYGMVIIPNSTIAEVLSQNPSNDPNFGPVALFSFNGANPSGISQMARLGSNLFGFEDMVGGGDQDYNDLILQFDFLPA